MIQEFLVNGSFPAGCRCQLAVMDFTPQINGVPNIGQTSMIVPNALTASVYYDAGNTIRLVGSVTLNPPTAVTLSFTENVLIGTNPQSATVTASFYFPSILFYDSGNLALTGGPVPFVPPAIPITGLYSIVAGNQSLSGIFNYALSFQTAFIQISNITPASFVISTTQSNFNFPASDIVRGLTAANGMTFNLVGGISDGTYSSIWTLNPMTAQLQGRPAAPTNLRAASS